MKIGILTQPLGHNYGGILQNYALQRVLRELGHEPITITHHGLKASVRLKNNVRAIAAYIVKHAIHHPTRHLNQLPWDFRPYGEMVKFVKKNVNRTKYQPEISDRTIKRYGIEAVVIGSDQVWRPKYNGDYLKYMFGHFTCKECQPPIIAYAASFGCCDWEYSPEETTMARKNIGIFKGISVREDSAVGMCEKHLGVTAAHVLDPTLLLDPEEYNLLIPTKISQEVPNGCVGVYILDLTEQKKRIVELICKSIGKQPFYFGTIDEKDGQYLHVEHWLASFGKSSFIITDSFHGTAFSINYRKPFISIVNHDRGADRFTSLLKMFNLEDRMIEEINLIDVSTIAKTLIDWTSVNKILQTLRLKSLIFLETNTTY